MTFWKRFLIRWLLYSGVAMTAMAFGALLVALLAHLFSERGILTLSLLVPVSILARIAWTVTKDEEGKEQ